MPIRRADDDGVTDAQRTALDKHRRHGTASFVKFCFDDDTACFAVRICLQLLNLGDEKDILEEVIDARVLLCRDRHHDGITAVFFSNETILHEFLLDTLGIRPRLIDLVDGNDDWHMRRLRMIDCLDGLRHYAVVCRNHEDRDIRNLRAACAHRRERLMSRRIEEDDLLSFADDLIGTNVLCDAACLMRTDRGIADGIEQRRFAVIDVTHDRNDWRTLLQ